MKTDFRAWTRLGVAGVSVVVGALSLSGPGRRLLDSGGPRPARQGVQGDAEGSIGRGQAELSAGADDLGSVRVRRPAPLPKGSSEGGGGREEEAALTEEAVWRHYDPTREELVYRAMQVEREAGRELQNLLQVLDLDEESQDRVFAALVRASEYYHPSLQATGAGGAPITLTRGAGGRETGPVPAPAPRVDVAEPADGPVASSGAAAPRDEVAAVLTPEQADVYERYTSERAAFWVGVVEDAEQQLSTAP